MRIPTIAEMLVVCAYPRRYPAIVALVDSYAEEAIAAFEADPSPNAARVNAWVVAASDGSGAACEARFAVLTARERTS